MITEDDVLKCKGQFTNIPEIKRLQAQIDKELAEKKNVFSGVFADSVTLPDKDGKERKFYKPCLPHSAIIQSVIPVIMGNNPTVINEIQAIFASAVILSYSVDELDNRFSISWQLEVGAFAYDIISIIKEGERLSSEIDDIELARTVKFLMGWEDVEDEPEKKKKPNLLKKVGRQLLTPWCRWRPAPTGAKTKSKESL